MSLYSFRKFYDNNSYYSIENFISNITNQKIIKSYSELTGASTGFGFYAPNVLSSGYLSFSDDKSNYQFSFNNHENTIRYLSLNSMILSNELEKLDTFNKEKFEPINQDIKRIDSIYNDLIIKNLASHFIYTNDSSKILNVKFLVYNYPSLEEINRDNKKPIGEFLTLFEKEYSFIK